MNIRTTLVPSRRPIKFRPATVAVVIDVLRATSVIATAIQNGAASVVTAASVDIAREYRDGDKDILRGGERQCCRIDGFDFGNSPSEYLDIVNGRVIVMTTTNGTAAIEWATESPQLITAAFVNRSVALCRIRNYEHIELICSGTDGMVSGEDVLLAGEMVAQLSKEHRQVELDDSSKIAMTFWQSAFGDADATEVPTAALATKFGDCRGGQNLIQRGFEADLHVCARVDSQPCVPHRVATNPPRFEGL